MAVEPALDEARALVVPFRGIRAHGEHVAEEVFGGGVFVETADEVGHGAGEVVVADGWCVEEEGTGGVADGAGLVVGHAFEHFDFDEVGDLEVVAEGEGEGDVEEIV